MLGEKEKRYVDIAFHLRDRGCHLSEHGSDRHAVGGAGSLHPPGAPSSNKSRPVTTQSLIKTE